jgi:hypothetical protein
MKIFSSIIPFIVCGIAFLNHTVAHSQSMIKYQDRTLTNVPFLTAQCARPEHDRSNIPMITEMVNEINVDTLHKTMRQLQNWGSRFMLHDNRKEVATWLMRKFLSYGYTNVKLDSFVNIVQQFPYYDTTIQYNVVCTVRGTSAPEEVYVIGGHYDSYCDPDPYTVAPGVDNNGSSVAATLEIARVMAIKNFHPEATIQFTLFGAEELGLFGSTFDAHKAFEEGRDIRFMISMDMISNDPNNTNILREAWYPGAEWLSQVAAETIEQYTDITVTIFNTAMNGGSDSYSYWQEGFPAVAYIEHDLSPYCFTPADTLGNCNIPYLAKVAGGILAILAEQQLIPTPQGVNSHSSKTDIALQWKPTNNNVVRGVNVYRSETAGQQYQKINSTPVSGAVYHDQTAVQNMQYYYVLTTVNDSLQESGYSKEVTGARFNFCDTLLVISNLKGNLTTPDSVFAFYQAALDTIPFVWYDFNATHKVSVGLLSRYSSILWISNSAQFENLDNDEHKSVSEYISNGGNLLFAGFNPMRFWMNGITYPVKTSDTSLFHQLFKIDSVDRKSQCLMFRANAVLSDYDTLRVDSLKYSEIKYPGEIYNIEVFSPTPDASIVYRLDTKYDSTTSFGKMKHRPVGLEYMGADFKSILLSFPLYYIDTNDVQKFLHYVMTEKFIHSVGIEPIDHFDPFSLLIYPNPVADYINVDFNLSKSGRIKLSLMSMQGKILRTWIDSNLESGPHSLIFDINSQPSGVYYIVLQCNEERSVRKIVRIN